MTNPFNPSEIAKLAPFVPGSTARESTVHIDEATCKAQASKQWLLECRDDDGSHPITPHNVITMLIGGQEGFAAIAADLENARATVDLVCWGFDPAMELVRTAGTWPRGETYGELLRRITTRAKNPVKVRLLVWYGHLSSRFMKNMPGHTDSAVLPNVFRRSYLHLRTWNQQLQGSLSGLEPPAPPMTIAELRAMHCLDWWKWALDSKNKHQIEVLKRSVAPVSDGHAQASRNIDTFEKLLLLGFSTHHQKTILIDYHHEEGARAVGYVMGLNSLTGYWDTRQHRFNDPLRERQQDAPPGTSIAGVVEKIEQAKGETTDIRVDPLHDYACRIRGQALQFVHSNFHDAWLPNRGASDARKGNQTQAPLRLAEVARYAQGSRLQVIRTQPEENDQSIREIYMHATGQASNYLYVENQYFQYAEWAEHLVASREKHRNFYQTVKADRGPHGPNILHVFVVIPKPEAAQMIPRTFDTLQILGRSDLMHELNDSGLPEGQWVRMMIERDALKEWETQYGKTTSSRQAFERTKRPAIDAETNQKFGSLANRKYHGRPYQSNIGKQAAGINAPTIEQLELQGIRILVAMLESFDDGSSGLKSKSVKDKYRQIYIHSKLLLIDDAFFTVGSANLNMRSMESDSEINIATDDPAHAKKLRKEVWCQHTGGLFDGQTGSHPDVMAAYNGWQDLMHQNDLEKAKGRPIQGYITTFHDGRTSPTRHA